MATAKTFANPLGMYDPQTDMYTLPEGDTAQVYASAPTGCGGKELLDESLQWAECFLTEIRSAFDVYMPDARPRVVLHRSWGAFASKGKRQEHLIVFTSGLLFQLHDYIYSDLFSGSGLSRLTTPREKQDYLRKFHKSVIFFVTAHEYAHILYGACDRGRRPPGDREAEANEKALELLKLGHSALYRTEGGIVPCTQFRDFQKLFDRAAKLPLNEQIDLLMLAAEDTKRAQDDRWILLEAADFAKKHLHKWI